MMEKLVIATRASALALWQAYFVRDEIAKKISTNSSRAFRNHKQR